MLPSIERWLAKLEVVGSTSKYLHLYIVGDGEG